MYSGDSRSETVKLSEFQSKIKGRLIWGELVEFKLILTKTMGPRNIGGNSGRGFVVAVGIITLNVELVNVVEPVNVEMTLNSIDSAMSKIEE